MNKFFLFLGVTAMCWLLLTLLTSRESQAIFSETLSRATTWIYLALGIVVSALIVMLPILVTGTISVFGIMLSMVLHRTQKNAVLSVALLGDVSLNRLMHGNPALKSARDVQFHRARQNYGVITIINNTAYTMGIMTLIGLTLVVVFNCLTP